MSTQQQVLQGKKPGRWQRATAAAQRIFRRHSALMFGVFVATFALGAQPAAAQQANLGEYEVKSALLYNLTKFVEWPTEAFPDAQTPTSLCILGQDPFGSALTKIIAQKTANGRPLLIRRLQRGQPIRNCHVLFISASERKNLPQILESLKGSNVLTIGETDRFARSGGIVQIVLEEKQIRFEINLDAANREGIKISSKLLALARIVSAK